MGHQKEREALYGSASRAEDLQDLHEDPTDTKVTPDTLSVEKKLFGIHRQCLVQL